MTVYVDRAIPHPPPKDAATRRAGARHGHRWCHLFCDPGGEAELHALAKRIGLKSALDCALHGVPILDLGLAPPKCDCWFQPSPPSSKPHYDLTPPRREAALKAGAVELDREGLRAFFSRWNAHYAQLRAVTATERGPS